MRVYYDEEKIKEDIEKTRFKASKSLIYNIKEFSEMEERPCSLKEILKLKDENPNFSNNPKKEACFKSILDECYEQIRAELKSYLYK